VAIDVHAHLYPMSCLDEVRKLEGAGGPVERAVRETLHSPIRQDAAFQGAIAERLALMDAAGIQTHVLSFSAPNVWHPDPAVRAHLVRTFNDACTEVVHAHRGRFALFANVPLPFVDAAIAEAARGLGELGAVGMGVCSHFGDRPLDAPEFEPFYAYCNERKTALFFHPDGFCVPGALDDHGMTWAIGALFEDTIVVMRLIYSGLLERYPNVTWIVPHLGGTYPILAQRVDRVWGGAASRREALPNPPSTYLKRLYYDTVTPQASALRLAREVLGADRLVLGSDYPYVSRKSLADGPDLLREAGFSDVETEGVLRGNIGPALGLTGTPRQASSSV
jgi:6-methylsalicylate decarboxylase